MSYIPFALKLFLKNKKNLVILFIVLSYFVLFPIIYQFQHNQSLEEKKTEELAEVDLMMMPFTAELLKEGEEYVQSYDNLGNQRQLIVSQRVSLKMGQNDRYVDQELKLIEHRFKLLENNMAGIAASYRYDLYELHQAYIEAIYLKDSKLTFNESVLNDVNVWLETISLYTGLLFVLLLIFLTMDSNLERNEHASIIRSLPVTETKLVGINYLVYTWLFQFCSLTAAGLSLFLSIYIFESGDMNYPKVIYENGEFISIPSWQYALLLLMGFILLSNLIVLVSLLINRVTNNAYINLFAMSIIFMSLWIGESLNFSEVVSFNYFFDLPRTLTGELPIKFGLDTSYYIGQIIVTLLIVTSVLVLIFINKMTRYQKNK